MQCLHQRIAQRSKNKNRVKIHCNIRLWPSGLLTFVKKISQRGDLHVLLAQQRPGNELVVLGGVSREWCTKNIGVLSIQPKHSTIQPKLSKIWKQWQMVPKFPGKVSRNPGNC